jgi:hypothetical protein
MLRILHYALTSASSNCPVTMTVNDEGVSPDIVVSLLGGFRKSVV